MKPLPTGSPAAGEPSGECYSRSPHISRSCRCFPLATGSQRAREPSRSNPQRSACWGAKQAEKAQSRYRGANKISGTLAVSSFGQAQAPKPGESVLHTRCGPEVSASIPKRDQQCAFLAITTATTLQCLPGPGPGNGGKSLFPSPALSIPNSLSFLLSPRVISLVAAIPKGCFYQNNGRWLWVEAAGHLDRNKPCWGGREWGGNNSMR